MFFGIILHIIQLSGQHKASEIKVGLRKISCLILSAGRWQEQVDWRKADYKKEKNRVSKDVVEEVVGWSAHSKEEVEEEEGGEEAGGGEGGNVGVPVILSWYIIGYYTGPPPTSTKKLILARLSVYLGRSTST